MRRSFISEKFESSVNSYGGKTGTVYKYLNPGLRVV